MGLYLEKEMKTHFSILTWRIPMDRGAWQATVHGVTRVGHDLATKPPPPSVSSVAQLCPTLCNPMNRNTPGLPVFITSSRSLLKLMPIKLVMPSSHLILCRPLLLLPPTPPSIRVFSNEPILHEVAKVLEFQLQHQSFQ